MENLGKISKKLNFTKKSIWYALNIFIVSIVFICVKIGFEDDYSIKLSTFLFVLSCFLLLVYISFVLLSYIILPKNKEKESTGILFYLNTFEDYGEFRAISQKIVEKVKILSSECPQ